MTFNFVRNHKLYKINILRREEEFKNIFIYIMIREVELVNKKRLRALLIISSKYQHQQGNIVYLETLKCI